jgi:H+-translocating NAD(P) transhydrogenase subunit beta
MKPEVLRGLLDLAYLASALVFVGGLKRLTKLRTARSGTLWTAAAMLIAVVATLADVGSIDYQWIAGGLLIGSVAGALLALGTKPQSALGPVALLAGFGGLASALAAVSAVIASVIAPGLPGTVVERIGPAGATGGVVAFALAFATWLGAMALFGGLVTFIKAGATAGKPIDIPARGVVSSLLLAGALATGGAFVGVVDTPEAVSLALGLLGTAGSVLGAVLVLPFGKREMPAAVALLNAFSASAACAVGVTLNNAGLIAGGAMFAAASFVHAKLLLDAMNRSLASVVFGNLAAEPAGADAESRLYKDVRSCGVEEAAMVLEEAKTVVVVPGYGLAVAQAQNAARELSAQLEKRGIKVRYAVHPFSGRMPGHMNVLLSEADIPYEKLVELEAVNPVFGEIDVVIVIGANDVVNPAAERDSQSPLYGVPILQAYKARSVFVIKRSLRAGHVGVKNPLFEAENATMIYGDAKKVLQSLTSELKGGGMSHAA